MSFSASPLVPDAQAPAADAGAWARTAQRVIAAVTEALPQIPSASPLVVGEPASDVAAAVLPDPAGAAVTGYLGSGSEGKALLVVGQELVDALAVDLVRGRRTGAGAQARLRVAGRRTRQPPRRRADRHRRRGLSRGAETAASPCWCR